MDAIMQTQNNNESWASTPIDILENEAEYLVTADMPGMRIQDISVEYDDGQLRLSGQRQKTDYVLEGQWPTHFRRSLKVGEGVAVENISATLNQGVLHVHLPKVESKKARIIPVLTA